MLDFISGFTQCWWPSQTCRVDWPAWAAIGTGLGVAGAVFGPMVREVLRRRRVTVLYAASLIDALQETRAAISDLRREFRLEPEHQREDAWAVEGMIMAEREPHLRRDLHDRGQAMIFIDNRHSFAQWTEVDLDVAMLIAKAAGATGELAQTAAEPLLDEARASRDWDQYFRRLRVTSRRALEKVDDAVRVCLLLTHRRSWRG